jgi:hypothetical protein
MSGTSFSAAIDAWVRETQARETAVFRDAAQSVVLEMLTPITEGGNMPVRTGYLRASGRASTEALPRIDPAAKPPEDATPNSFAADVGQFSLVIAGASLDQTIYFGFTAAYAQAQENKRRFVGLAAQRWPTIVAESTAKAKAAVASRPSA